MSDIILETRGITKVFGGLTAVGDISIHLNKGEILGIIGANGAGKTTLFNLISGLLPSSSGQIILEGKDVTRYPAHKICAMGIGRTYQIVKTFGNLSVLENTMVGAFLRYPKADDARAKALEVLQFTGLYDVRNVLGSNLTLTQMKRLEVARALATEPKILLLDEVNAGLNPSDHPFIIKLIQDIRDSGVSIIMIEHVMRVIMNISNRIYAMNQGRLIAEGLPAEVAADPQVIKSYFGERRNAEH